MNWKPTGRPSSSRPHGMLMAGMPARSAGIVNTSDRYIARGSSARSPIRNAVVGDVGAAMTSTSAKACTKSRMTSVRTFCACP